MKKIDPALIGFDIDGVVADTGGAFIRIAREDYGINSLTLEDITSFEVIDCLNVEFGIINEIFGRLLDDPLKAGLQPMADAIGVLNGFAAAAPLTFVTARPHAEPIAGWLEYFLEPAAFEGTRLVAMGEHDNKPSYIKDLGLKYFVDDRLQTCQMLAREGITPLVYNQPWNRTSHNLQTVNDWQAIRALSFD
jgi:uncharacterized HAD superfamily protein